MSLQDFLQPVREIVSVDPVIVGYFFGIRISNTNLFALLVTLVVCFIAYKSSSFSKSKPTKFQLLIEVFYTAVFDLISQISGEKAVTKIIFPLVSSVFIFILFSNLLGLVPVISAITTADEQMLFRTATGDINTTLSLALSCVILVHVFTIRYKGVKAFFDGMFHYTKIKKALTSGFKGIGEIILAVFMTFLEWVGEGSKILSLSLRLFGNLFAGDVLMTILVGIIAFGIPAIWLGLSVLTAVVQAVVFTSLVSIFFSLNLSGVTASSDDTT